MYQRIRDLREDKEKNQTQIAEFLETSQRQYSRWEAGEYEVPFKVAIQLAEYYNVSVDYIAGITNETKPYPRVK